MTCKCGEQKSLYIATVGEDAIVPERAHSTDSGLDLFSTEEVRITPYGRALIKTGVKAYIPEGYELQVRSKSGLALKKGLMVLNSPGTIDRGYADEIGVIVFNANPEPAKIEKGQKIAQLVMCPVCIPSIVKLSEEEIDNMNSSMDRGMGGFGSTGLYKK